MCSNPPETQLITYLPSARLMERNRGYSSGAGLPCWSSYRKTGLRPTSTPSCWMPCWLYTDSRKDWRPAFGLMVNMMEKSSGKAPSEGGKIAAQSNSSIQYKMCCVLNEQDITKVVSFRGKVTKHAKHPKLSVTSYCYII